jgi:nucleoside-triphosphatase THEP1
MVKIVTGDMNSGKTTHIYSLYKQTEEGDGFIQLKTMQDNKVHHYDILFLKSKLKKKLAFHQTFYENQFKEPFYFGPYVFNQEIFFEVDRAIDMMIKDNVKPIYLDEIGMLEIKQKGYAPLLKKLLKQDMELVITVKESLITEVINTFNIQKYEVIR